MGGEPGSGPGFQFFASIPCLLLTTRRKLRRAVPPYRVGAPIAPASADAFLTECVRSADPLVRIQRAIGAMTAPTSLTRSSGASPISRPRRPPLT